LPCSWGAADSTADTSSANANNDDDNMNINEPSTTADNFYKSEPYYCSTTSNGSVNNNKLPTGCIVSTDNNTELPGPSSTAAIFYHNKKNELSSTSSSTTACNDSPFNLANSPKRSSLLYSRALTSIYNSNVNLSACAILGASNGCGKTNLLAALRHNNTLYSNTTNSKGSADTQAP
jgi:hypothetical protein